MTVSLMQNNDNYSGVTKLLKKYASFIGPGIMVSVAYMDPGNYSTSVSSGAKFEYQLLVVIFFSNIFAVLLQSLCVKLGTVTGLDLAEMCRLNLNPHLNLFLYICTEIAIIATDLAEVVGTAISLEILFHIPLLIGVLITVIDVLVILTVYDKDGSLKQTRIFEYFVSALVLCTCCCFVFELFKCDFDRDSIIRVIEGFLPTKKDAFKHTDAMFLSCGIVGSTIMPHSLFLGSALVQPRLKEYDMNQGLVLTNEDDITAARNVESSIEESEYSRALSGKMDLLCKYKPSFDAINYCLTFSYIELAVSLFTIAVFVNSSILIVAGNSLFKKPDAENADLLTIYELLSNYISPAAGLIFALSMLFAGQSAGIVCTMAGQIVSEGFLNWTIAPWKRRIITRVLAIVPVLIVIGLLGREGVSKVMNGSQVVLSFVLPFVVAPLIYFTSKEQFMTVKTNGSSESTSLLPQEGSTLNGRKVSFVNGKLLHITSLICWLVITFLNLYLIFLFLKGYDV